MVVTTVETIAADAAVIRSDLELMVARWNELTEKCMFELRALAEDKREQWDQFTLTRMSDAVEWVMRMNDSGYNIYAARNPIRFTHRGPATDDAILAAFFCWADCDTPDATSNVKRFDGPKWTHAITTGHSPDTRVHVYWQLEKPCYDMPAWRGMQVAIATHFNSDRVVVNPSRIMRVAGTVSYPNAKKQAKGYTPEFCTLRTTYSDGRAPVSFERLSRVFAPVNSSAHAEDGIHIDTGDTFDPPLDRALAAANILNDNNWRNNVKSLVCSYVARGWTDDEIISRCDAFTLQGYTVEDTRKDVKAFIVWARQREAVNGGRYAKSPEHTAEPNFDGSSQKKAGIQILSTAEFLADWKPQAFLWKGIVEEGRLLTMCGPTGTGKTAIALLIAFHIAQARALAGRRTRQAGVLFLAGENPLDVKTRWLSMLRREIIDPMTMNVHFVEGRFSIEQQIDTIRAHIAQHPTGLVIPDTLQAFFDGDDSNSNDQMKYAALGFREITKSGPAVLIPAHPRKGATKDSNVPYGGGALLNEVDGNLCLWGTRDSVEMHWSGKFRGSFDPVHFALDVGPVPDVVDRDGDPIVTVTARTIGADEAESMQETRDDDDIRLLCAIHSNPGASVRTLGDICAPMVGMSGWSKSNVNRRLSGLEAQGLVEKAAGKVALTPKGRRFVENIE